MTDLGAARARARRRRLRWASPVAVLVALTAACSDGSALGPGDGSPAAPGTHADDPSSAPTGQSEPSDVWAEFYGVTDPPDVEELIQVMPEERQRYQDDCLRAAGYDVLGPGTITIPKHLEDAITLAQYTCAVQYGVIPRYAQEWGTDQKHIQYTWTLVDVVPCLEAEGHPITGVPGQLSFVATYDTAPFYPFAQVKLDIPGTEEYNAEWARLEAACPQIAPSQVLWDGMSIEDWRAAR